MLEFLSATNRKKKTLIEFELMFEVTKSTIKVKPSRQIMTLPQPNASSTVLSAPIFFKLLGLYIKDFYLNNHMDEYEYIWLQRWIFPNI